MLNNFISIHYLFIIYLFIYLCMYSFIYLSIHILITSIANEVTQSYVKWHKMSRTQCFVFAKPDSPWPICYHDGSVRILPQGISNTHVGPRFRPDDICSVGVAACNIWIWKKTGFHCKHSYRIFQGPFRVIYVWPWWRHIFTPICYLRPSGS